jgi:hypothetical protein
MGATDGPNGGVTDTLGEAKAASRAAAGERQRPLPRAGADEICEGASRSWRDQPVQVRPR